MRELVHQTDLFHPHGDPDDHWDLATLFALASRGAFALQGVMLDYPPKHRVGDPGTLAVAQLSHLTGIVGVPTPIGSMHPMRDRRDRKAERDARDTATARWLCTVLERAAEPVTINIVGSCTDVAIAGLMRPDLFRDKCHALYLNAGAANPGAAGELEYNVRLNPSSYAAVLDLPCPIYWCPCWHQTEVREVGEHGSWYSFEQSEVLEQLSEPMCNFFIYMLSQSSDPKYLRYLHGPVDIALKADFGARRRSMWSTAAILDAGGMGVDTERGLLPKAQVAKPVFEFIPVQVSCADDGATNWQETDKETGRYLLRIVSPERYASSMTGALGALLREL